jgi:hypothetical protein
MKPELWATNTVQRSLLASETLRASEIGVALEWLRSAKSILGKALVICRSGHPKYLQSLQFPGAGYYANAAVSHAQTSVAQDDESN